MSTSNQDHSKAQSHYQVYDIFKERIDALIAAGFRTLTVLVHLPIVRTKERPCIFIYLLPRAATQSAVLLRQVV